MYRFRIIPFALVLSALVGCSKSGSVYNSYREVEQLRLVQTVGIDKSGGEIALSVSTGQGASEATAPILMTAQAQSITGAMALLQDYSVSEDLYYAHTKYIILGAGAAQDGIEQYLDYIERTPQLRLNTSLFVMREGTAEELVRGVGGESYDISTDLNSLTQDAQKHGEYYVFTCRDTAKSLAASGCALVCALETREMEPVSSESEGEGLAAFPCGYCVIKDGAAVGYITGEDATAVSILTDKVGDMSLALDDGMGGCTTVQLTGSKCKITAVPQGSTFSFNITVTLSAAVTEMQNPASLAGSGSPQELAARLEELIYSRCCAVLDASRRMNADVFGLGTAANRAYPVAFSRVSDKWDALYPNAEIRVAVSAAIERSYESAEKGGASN
jgi:Ger(x)C family germination protein